MVMTVAALIMAGGSGERFRSTAPKQLVPIAGRPMIAWSASVLASVPQVASIILVTPSGVEMSLTEAMPPEASRKVRAVVAGGATRQESVYNGLKSLPGGTTHVLIHDAARPCMSHTLVTRILDSLETHDAVIPSVPITDTLVREVDGSVDAIVDRAYVAGVQTPQGFRAELILRAHREAAARGFQTSDDGSLVLALGLPVHTVAGERSNLKVTFAEDVRTAEAHLAGRTL